MPSSQSPAKVEKTSKAVADPIPQRANAPHIGKQDFIAAKILPMQYMSEKVKDQTAKAGEFRDTIENKIFGSTEHPFEVIPLAASNFWVEYEVNPKGDTYLGQYNLTAQNEGQPREATVDGKKLKRVQTIECFVLVPEEVKAGTAFPYVISFRMTSLRAGRTLLSQIYTKNKMSGKDTYGNVLELSLKESSNDKGDFFVQNVRPKRAATEAEVESAKGWCKTIDQGAVAKDDSDLKTGAMEDTKTDQF